MEISVSLDPAAGNDLEKYVEFLDTVDDISLHLDIMDGQFVARKSTTKDEADFTIKNTRHKIDIHYMINDIALHLNPYLAKAVWGSIRSISFHIETFTADETPDILTLFKKIRIMGVEAGIAIDLDTNLKDMPKEVLDACDVATIMSVKAGASGQAFNATALDKVKTLRKTYPNLRIIIDGGINAENITQVKRAGATTAVVGSAIFNAPDRIQEIRTLQKLSG